MKNLEGAIAVVAGGSRGAGRGIALSLGDAGATVYVTGRSVRGATTENVPGSVDETAEEVTARGGIGIAARCDYTEAGDVEALFERVRREQGRLDILVNSAWGGNERFDGRTFDDGTTFANPFWEQSLERWDAMFTRGVRSYAVASRYAVPLMLQGKRGLIINVSFDDNGKYIGHLYYDLAKNAMNRLAFAMAQELRGHGIAAIALSPGHMRTERVLAVEGLDLSDTESTEYIGRAVAALAADPDVMRKSGGIHTVGALAREYGFTDVDGTQPPPFTMPA